MVNQFKNIILVLDDDPFMLKLIAHMLEGLGCTSVTTLDNGPAALKMVDRPNERPDLILLDLNMPGMDGMEFIRHLVEHRYSGSLILMSGEDEHLLRASEKLVRAHKIPLLGLCHKPVTGNVLASLLERFPLAYQNNFPAGNNVQSANPPAENNVQSANFPAENKVDGSAELRAAIANGELINCYQPIVSLSTGRLVGVEALVRWCSPQNGMVYPYKFLGIAERSGLINELTQTILTNALVQTKAWLDEGMSLRLAVNVSTYNLESLKFADSVIALAAAANVAPQNVVLEVAESWLPMHDQPALLETLTRLHLNRFRLSIDEFGTGYFSAAQLHGMPFDEIKIDRSLVHGISTNTRLKARFDATLAIARRLNMEAGAVGVENGGDWGMLRRSGCEHAQGSFIANPMPADQFPGWLQAWQTRVLEERLVNEKVYFK
jgi:EAL domain-containing protein (putative c-di-GMP-specific phosphodiesterase class I)/CheY-like chemotaxis protein